MRHFKILGGVVIIAFTAAGVWFGIRQHAGPAADDAALAGLFSQSMVDVEGHAQPLAQWRGKMLLVNFWATWCPPCVQEMPELSALQKQARGAGLQVIGIGIDTPSAIAEFSQKLPVSYPLYVGGMGATDISRQLGNQSAALPYTVLIDSAGHIVKRYRGRLQIEAVRADIQAANTP
jgi:thiol-disulfide isomerase/thioredoxin